MKKFILRIFLFILTIIVTYNLIIYLLYGKSFLTSSCTSPKNEKYDFVLMGTSHTQVFYKYIVEKIISIKMKNLSTGAAGIIPEKIILICFFKANNKTKQIVYLLDPWILYSRRWNEDNYILQQEGIEYSYFLKLLENNIDKKVVFNYFRDKLIDNFNDFIRKSLTPKDITPTPVPNQNLSLIKKPETLENDHGVEEQTKRDMIMAQNTPEEQLAIDKAGDKLRLDVLYNEGLNNKNFSKYSKHLEQVILLVKKHNARIVFIIPPTLMGKMPGSENVMKLLSRYKQDYGTNYYDLSLIMQDLIFYWDREHLTEKGVEYFTQNYLKRILTDQQP